MPRVAGPGKQVWDGNSSGEDEPKAGNAQAGESVFERYLDALGSDIARDDQVFSHGLGKVRQYLASASADSSACLICLGTIKPTEAVWSCSGGCWAVLHMTCMQEWARSQIEQCVLKTMNRLTQFPGAAAEARANAEWGCPKCRRAYPASGVPRTYTCFCGSVVDPEWDPWCTAHSCGEMCGRALGAQDVHTAASVARCTHTCLLLCHPGPCPPCPLVVDAPCHCGARRERRRCGHHEFSCGGTCNAKLPCGHTCRQSCHPGECPPCDLEVQATCRCKSQARTLTCSTSDFQCDRACGKRLACGNHTCDEICHSGPCGPCPSEGRCACPCGQITHEGLSCMDKVPTCGNTCGKLLPCGQHTCQDRCHVGDCSSCRATIMKTCRCGKVQKQVACTLELLCERRCSNTRQCGRHPCKRRCCRGGDACPPCEETCGRKLRCGNHKCPAPCHQGPCRPCPLTVSFACACGQVSAMLPCGAEARAVPPRCNSLCQVPAVCRHATTAGPHRCHYGPCPPCTRPCGTPLPCGHACGSATCHDTPPPTVPPFMLPTAPKVQLTVSAMMDHPLVNSGSNRPTMSTTRNGQSNDGSRPPDVPPVVAVVAAARQVLACQHSGSFGPSTCPPCVLMVPVGCLGGHETKQVQCNIAGPYQCARPCGQRLGCGNHMCEKPCHLSSIPCGLCTRPCGNARPCGHPCARPCHAAPCGPCDIPSRTPCHCGKASLTLTCADLSTARTTPGPTTPMSDPLCCNKPCHKPLPDCPHPCRVPCHRGSCTDAAQCGEEITVRCSCKRLKSKWTCAKVREALVAAGRPAAYDTTTSLRLLPCDADCAAAGVVVDAVKRPSGSGMASTAAAAAVKNTAADMVKDRGGSGVAGGEDGSIKHRPSKAQREAEAVQRQKAKERQARMQQIRSTVMWALVLLVGLALGVGVPRLLAYLDHQAQSKWKLQH